MYCMAPLFKGVMPGEAECHRTPIPNVHYSAELQTSTCTRVPEKMIVVDVCLEGEVWHRTETSARVGKLTLPKQELLLATPSNNLESSYSDTNDLSR
jgi:hypothetical protein